MILRTSLPLVVICGICELSMVAAEDPALDQNDHFGAGDQIVSQAPLGFFTPATIPTKPRSIQSICPEWEPSGLVLISVPLRGTLPSPNILKFILDFLESTVSHVPVGVLYDRDEAKYLGRFIREIERNPELESQMDRIDFIESRVQSYWIRDHGPLFGRSADDELLVVDSIYRLLDVESVYDPLRLEAFSFAKQRDYSNDLTPQFIANYLRSDLEYETLLTRPPLHLHGGDLAVNGRGDLFLSEDTISENGGDMEAIEAVFRQYFAAENIHILSGPIGNSAKHLDLLFKIAKPGVILASRAPAENVQSDSYGRKLHKQLSNRLGNNLNYIRRNLPESTKVIELPMPSLLVTRKQERLEGLRNELLNVVCRKVNVDFRVFLNGNQNSTEVENARSAVALEMLISTGLNVDLALESHLDVVSRKYLGVSIDEYLETYVDHPAIYRSYTNSLIIANARLETLILLPRFIPQPGELKETYTAYEREVEKVYSDLYPDAELRWIESDMITSLGGSIHCMSIGVPLQMKLKTSRKPEVTNQSIDR